MKILIAIKTCHRYRERAQAQQETWLPRLAAAVPDGWTVDARLFVGRMPAGLPVSMAMPAGPDLVNLDCDDTYHGLPEKFRGICRWALDRGYDYIFNCDDDVYIVPERLLASGFQAHHYSGRLRGPSGGFPAPYASGFAVWLSRRTLEILAEAPPGKDRRDDRWIGNMLSEHGIRCHRESQFVVARSSKNAPCAKEGARSGNQFIAACEFGPVEIRHEHRAWIEGWAGSSLDSRPALNSPFSHLSVLMSTFLRDGCILRSIRDIESHLPGGRIVLIDDGYESRTKITAYCQLARRGHVCEWLPFNSPPRQRLDAALAFLDRPYTLVASDDLNFAGPGASEGVRSMLAVLDGQASVNAIAGTVDHKAREGFVLMRTGLLLLAYLPSEEADLCRGVNINRHRDPVTLARNSHDRPKYRRGANDLLNT